MKKTVALLFISFLSIMTANAKNSVQWLAVDHNFGAFDEDDGPVEFAFRYVNTGDEPIAVTGVRVSCGCTASDYNKEPIAPGDTSEVIVRYDPAARPGRFHKYVVVDFSSPECRQRLNISGTVVGSKESLNQFYHAECSPMMKLERGTVMMGEIKKGSLKTVFLKAYNSAHDSITPSVRNLPPYLDVKVAPEKVAPGEQTSFIFYFNSAKCPDYGFVSDSVYISPDPISSTICYVPVTAMISEDFSKLTPKELAKSPVVRIENRTADFGVISGTEPVEREVTITNMGKSPLIVRRVYSTDKGVSCRIGDTKIKPGKSAVITLTVRPSDIDGDILSGRASVITNDPADPTINIRLSGEFSR